MSNWTGLYPEILDQIARRIDLVFLAFGEVCKSWHKAASELKFRKQAPWLMLADNKHGNDGNTGGFFVLGLQEIHKLHLPEAKGQKYVTAQGRLVIVTKDREMYLLHPFTRHEIKLPPRSTLNDNTDTQYISDYYAAVALSANPSESSDFALMVVFGVQAGLALWRAGDEAWMVIDTEGVAYSNVAYHKGKFYAVDYQSRVVVCNTHGPNPTVEDTVAVVPPRFFRCPDMLYLVESSGRLLVVLRAGRVADEDPNDPSEDLLLYETNAFEVYEIDLSDDGVSKEVTDLGNNSFLLGYNLAFSIDASVVPGFSPNCIYYTDGPPGGRGKDMGFYSLEDGISNASSLVNPVLQYLEKKPKETANAPFQASLCGFHYEFLAYLSPRKQKEATIPGRQVEHSDAGLGVPTLEQSSHRWLSAKFGDNRLQINEAITTEIEK
ncbi:Domain unknown function DUF295 [Dillenia turbinata]|uniref:KIB1-4 beta-propeller domain-containing protein n=1 Tax=Dillenia turbinata TaxID=194707 RepID=A0AAN8ZWJ0_9MAGN